MNILIVQSTDSGVFYHRQLVPHYAWHDSGDVFQQDVIAIVESRHHDKIVELTDKYHFDIIQFSVGVVVPSNMVFLVDFLKARGTKVVVDIDDIYKNREDVAFSLKIADAVTTTSENMRKYIKQYTSAPCYIIENGIDSKEAQWQIRERTDDVLTFGYLGSTRHEKDLKSMQYDFSTAKLHTVVEEYKEILHVDTFSKLKHWSNYAYEYDVIDCAIAPLVKNEFNDAKSALKIFEAGFKKKGIICTYTEPYSRYYNFDSIIFIPKHKSWKSVIESLSLTDVKELGEQLYEDVQPFEIRNLNKLRRDVYIDIVK